MKRNAVRDAALDAALIAYRDRCLDIYRTACPPSQRMAAYTLARNEAKDRIYAATGKKLRRREVTP